MTKPRASRKKKSPVKKKTIEVLNLQDVKFTLTSEVLKNNVCRVCAKYYSPGADLMPLYRPYPCASAKPLADVVNAFLPIKVIKGDGLPEHTCHSCADQLLEWRKMWDTCMEADKLLHTELTNQLRMFPRNDPSPARSPERRPDTPTYDSDSDSAPLAELASNPLADLRRALRALRDHYVQRHLNNQPETTTEQSEDELKDDNVEDADRFDDLTRNNMRRDRFDDETRAALDAARARDHGRTYYLCAVCGRRLASPHAFVHHGRIHTGERPQVCHVCGKRFRAPQGLARHLTETHERRRRRPCRLCDRTFANEQNLRQHLRTHTGERPYQCNECGKRFAQSGSLHAHRRTHTPGRAFSCADCGAAFRLRAGLTRHALRHSGERPHRCACGRAFAARHELTAHLPLHGDLTPHACHICGAAYKLRRALRDHTRRAHPAHPALPAELTRASFPGTMPT